MHHTLTKFAAYCAGPRSVRNRGAAIEMGSMLGFFWSEKDVVPEIRRTDPKERWAKTWTGRLFVLDTFVASRDQRKNAIEIFCQERIELFYFQRPKNTCCVEWFPMQYQYGECNRAWPHRHRRFQKFLLVNWDGCLRNLVNTEFCPTETKLCIKDVIWLNARKSLNVPENWE